MAARLSAVRADIADAARSARRDPAELTTIAVTKFQPASLVRELAVLGQLDVGENRHQEAQAKAVELEGLGLRWHFVGQLQSNKARQLRRYASFVHSVDRISLVEALAARPDDGKELIGAPGREPLGVFVQLSLSDDLGRGGVPPAELEALAERVLAAPGLVLLGVMAVAPLGEEPARAFARLREASDGLRRLAPAANAISAGMSGDFREAIAAGATHLRIGTAITGSRPEAR